MKNIDEVLNRYLPSASEDQMDSGGARVLGELRARADRPLNDRGAEFDPAPFFVWRRIAMASAVAAVFLAVLIGTVVVWRQGAPGVVVVESVDGGLYRVVEGNAQALRVHERVGMGERIHSNGGSGGTLVLADGSRVEMRSQSELSLERVEDGVRIRLNSGGVIVNAAKQRAGRHLYVQTKDVVVSVVGTVFLVNADKEGSRVAVIEGEVRVQQGTVEERLRPGEQVITNPSMSSRPVKEQISWSRDAEAHMALLQQSSMGHLEAVRLLLDSRVDPNLSVPRDGSPLIVAAREGRLDVVRLLLDRGADPNMPVPGEGNPLIVAAREGHADVVTLLLDRGARIDEVVPLDENALISASSEGRLDVVRLLVSRGANVNARAWSGPRPSGSIGEWRTPLSEARREGRQDVVRFLLSAGAKE